MRVLIGGCSFSEKKMFDKNSKWIPWSDLLSKDFDENYCEISNEARSSYGQSKIVESLLSVLIEKKFEIDYVFIQWSAIGRSYAMNQEDFVQMALKQGELYFSSNLHEYIIDEELGWVTNLTKQIDDSFYTTSLSQIVLMKNLLENYNIPYTMFWGWNQITNSIYKKNKKIFDIIYDDSFWRYGDHGGMSEYIIDTIGQDKGILQNDFHPTTEGHQLFYDNIIKPIADKKLRFEKPLI